MRVALGGDHAGFPLKQPAASWIKDLGHEVIDVGPFAYDPDDDYPDFTFKVTDAVVSGRAVRGSWSAAAAWEPAWLPTRCQAFAAPSATTPIRRTKGSSTTT